MNGEKICTANFPKGKQSSGLFIGEGRTGKNPVTPTIEQNKKVSQKANLFVSFMPKIRHKSHYYVAFSL